LEFLENTNVFLLAKNKCINRNFFGVDEQNMRNFLGDCFYNFDGLNFTTVFQETPTTTPSALPSTITTNSPADTTESTTLGASRAFSVKPSKTLFFVSIGQTDTSHDLSVFDLKTDFVKKLRNKCRNSQKRRLPK
jgi:hypothetical protein